jgi:hypothetical protein
MQRNDELNAALADSEKARSEDELGIHNTLSIKENTIESLNRRIEQLKHALADSMNGRTVSKEILADLERFRNDKQAPSARLESGVSVGAGMSRQL